MGQQQLREHWIASSLRGWLSDWLETQAAERLLWLQRLRLRWWGWKWPEHLHTFKLLTEDEQERSYWWSSKEVGDFHTASKRPTRLTWEAGHAPENYAERSRRVD